MTITQPNSFTIYTRLFEVLQSSSHHLLNFTHKVIFTTCSINQMISDSYYLSYEAFFTAVANALVMLMMPQNLNHYIIMEFLVYKKVCFTVCKLTESVTVSLCERGSGDRDVIDIGQLALAFGFGTGRPR